MRAPANSAGRGKRPYAASGFCAREAAVDFVPADINVNLVFTFAALPGGQFDDGALRAIEKSQTGRFSDGLAGQVFNPDAVGKSVRENC